MEVSSNTEVLKRLDVLYQKMDSLNSEVVRLRVTNETHKEASIKNSTDIEILKADVQSAKGGLGILRLLITLCGSSVIGFTAWLVISYTSTQAQISDINHKVALLESVVNRYASNHP